MNHFEIKEVSKSYKAGFLKRKVQAVNNLSLQIMQGEVFGLIGPNGAGKSTSIRMLLGLIRPDSGAITYLGKPLDWSSLRKEIGYLPENPYLYDHLTLAELLFFCGQTSGLNSQQINRRGQELIERLNLADAYNRPLRTFSKGMLQRAGISFALLHNPSIVILDEPMSGLDPVGRKMVFDLVLELKKQGKTIFFCSHILNDVERLCDRIGMMNKGRLIEEFKQEDFLQNLGQTVFIHIAELAQNQLEQLQALGSTTRKELDGHLLAVPNAKYHAVNKYLEESGAEVLGCRSEWMSLEDLFMQAVEEQAS